MTAFVPASAQNSRESQKPMCSGICEDQRECGFVRVTQFFIMCFCSITFFPAGGSQTTEADLSVVSGEPMLNRSGSARLRPGWQRLTSSRDLGVYHLALSPPATQLRSLWWDHPEAWEEDAGTGVTGRGGGEWVDEQVDPQHIRVPNVFLACVLTRCPLCL